MPRRTTLSALALSAALLLGACQNPDGSTDWGSTLLLGAGVGLATALVAGAASDNGRPSKRSYGPGHYGQPRGAYGRPPPAYVRGGYPAAYGRYGGHPAYAGYGGGHPAYAGYGAGAYRAW